MGFSITPNFCAILCIPLGIYKNASKPKIFFSLYILTRMTRHRSWCFTINNWTETDMFAVKLLMSTRAAYGVCGRELGDVNEIPHLQGYIRLTNPLSLEVMKKSLVRAHLIVANGSDKENQKYCSKQHCWNEWGTISEGQGQRNDIKEVAGLIRSGEVTITDVMFDYPDLYLKYSRSFEKMFNAVQPIRKDPPQVHWRYGLAGTGKTRYVIDTYGIDNVYIKDGTPWWDNYTQQNVILIDDFDNNIPYRTLLRILDRYSYQGQVKGGYVQINSPHIYITCEYPPDHYWNSNELAQVLRRLTSVQEII